MDCMGTVRRLAATAEHEAAGTRATSPVTVTTDATSGSRPRGRLKRMNMDFNVRLERGKETRPSPFVFKEGYEYVLVLAWSTRRPAPSCWRRPSTSICAAWPPSPKLSAPTEVAFG